MDSPSPGERLLRWAERHGATVSASWRVLQPVAGNGDRGDPGDRTCHATERLEEGRVLLRLPRALALEVPPDSGPLGVEPDFLAALRCQAHETLVQGVPASSALMVALLVCRERLQNDSAFADYLDSLPTSYPTMPLLDEKPSWDADNAEVEDELQDSAWIYDGTAVRLLASSGQGLAGSEGLKAMRRVSDRLGASWPNATDAQLRWAAASVQSRAHARRGGGTILLPVADCFNHSPSNANCEVLQHADAIEVVTSCEIDPGQGGPLQGCVPGRRC